jgi:hypothetical protein
MRTCAGLIMLICVSAFAGQAVVPPFAIKVLADGEHCVVNNQPMRCDDVVSYVRDTLRIGLDRSIGVIVEGPEQAEARSQRVRDLIRGAGYSRISWGSFTAADHGSSGP